MRIQPPPLLSSLSPPSPSSSFILLNSSTRVSPSVSSLLSSSCIQYQTSLLSVVKQRAMSLQNWLYVSLFLPEFRLILGRVLNLIPSQGASTTVVGSKMYLYVCSLPSPRVMSPPLTHKFHFCHAYIHT